MIFSGAEADRRRSTSPPMLGAADDPFVTVDPGTLRRAVDRFLAGSSGAGPRPAEPQEEAPRPRRKHEAGSPCPGWSTRGGGRAAGRARRRRGRASRSTTRSSSPPRARYMGRTAPATIYPRPTRSRPTGTATGPTASSLARAWSASTTASRARPGRPRRSCSRPSEIRARQRQATAALLRRRPAAASSPGAPRTGRYWVSNTLLGDLANRQMLAMAAIADQRIGIAIATGAASA